MRAWRRILGALVTSTLCFGSVVACSSIVGIQEVHRKGAKATSPDDDAGDELPPDDGDAGQEPPKTNTHANVLMVVLGREHTCAKKPDGTVSCWGDDEYGQTGGGTVAASGSVPSPRAVQGISDAIDISAGDLHTCVVRKSGKVSCWGFNLTGQLGNGETSNIKAAPVDVKNITNGFAVAAGGSFTCVLRGSGSVACWGQNGSGQLGKGDNSDSATPVAVPGLTGVVSIAAGLSHVCAVKSTGAVVCWGDGNEGQLGSASGSATPVPVDGITDAVSIAAGSNFSCVLRKSGGVKCWGGNDHGQLGDGDDRQSPSPVDVQGLSDAAWIAAGCSQGAAHVCAAETSGSVVCWGAGGNGQLGDGVTRSTTAVQATPVSVMNLSGAVSVGAGQTHSCAASKSQVWCWGGNGQGQLGTSDTNDSPTPVPITIP